MKSSLALGISSKSVPEQTKGNNRSNLKMTKSLSKEYEVQTLQRELSWLPDIILLLVLPIFLLVACLGPTSPGETATETEIDVTPIASSTIAMRVSPTLTVISPVIPTIMPAECQQANGSTLPGKIAFESRRDRNVEIYVMNADATQLTRLTNTSGAEISPAWSPDGLQIAFISWPEDGSSAAIYTMKADGSERIRLTHTTKDASDPAWSPDGSKFAFTFDEPPYYLPDIYVMNADGSEPVNLTNNPANDSDPAWSPDGSKIVFVSDRDGNDEIYVMNVDGSDPVNVTSHPASDRQPTFSPDGSKIAFVSERDDIDEIYVMNVDGSELTNLTSSPNTTDMGPSWSPGGCALVYTSEVGRDKYSDIHIMNADGSEKNRLTFHIGDDAHPSWGP